MRRRIRRWLTWLALVVVAGALLILGGAWLTVRGSLPRTDGSIEVAGLAAPVRIARDDLGVVDIRAASRADAAFALGFAHAQDRYFQMDLQRRAAAGELAALFGPVALGRDRDTRRHLFRMRARSRIRGLPLDDRALIEAYTAGVNAGLADLRVRPFEYLLLRQRPQPWQAEDTILTLYSMFLDLAYSTAIAEENWAVVSDRFPAGLADFLLPRADRWEAPLMEGGPAWPTLPDSSVVDMHDWTFDGRTYDEFQEHPRQDAAGSNCWAVAGTRAGHGRAMLANDMHLGLQLPNTWYRARLGWTDADSVRSVVGVTLPGAPAVVAGSNGRVAWGFTNSYGDWSDLVRLSGDSTRYRTPDGWQDFEHIPESIEIAGTEPDTLWIENTLWGPVWGTDIGGRRFALRWTAHDPDAANLELLRLETARDVDEAVAVAARLGIPAQNLICADATGRIGWGLAGRIPRRVGFDGRLPVSWASGRHRWDGYLDPSEGPRIVDPEEGLIWTANNRVASGEALELIGDGGYALGVRARQIRDGLRSLDRPVERDLLALQLDDRALFLEQWRELILAVLARHSAELGAAQRQFLRKVGEEWEGRAAIGSVSYRLVRNAVYECIDAAFAPFAKACAASDPDFDPRWLPHRHEVTWQLLTEQPHHLLPPWFDTWDEAVLAAVDSTMAGVERTGLPLARFTWGARNEVSLKHPFAALLPRLSRWLATEPRPLPGDSFMPRVQGTGHGASERMVVSPGHESEAIFHMPGGQSGHPLSPWFLAGHRAWEEGRPTGLLPGEPRHQLELRPAGRP